MPHFEGSHSAQNVKGHVGYFRGVTVAIGNRKTRRHHVSVADGLHLEQGVTRTFSGDVIFFPTKLRVNSAPCRRRGCRWWRRRLCKECWEVRPPRWVRCWPRWWWSPRCHWSKGSRCQNAQAPLCRQLSGPRPQIWRQNRSMSPTSELIMNFSWFGRRSRTAATSVSAASLSSASRSPAPPSSPWSAPPG